MELRCPLCGGRFFFSLPEEELTAANWNWLGSRAVDEQRSVDALACYQRAAALGDPQGITNLGWCMEQGIL